MSLLAENFLKMYDTCKQTQSAEQCRSVVAARMKKRSLLAEIPLDSIIRFFGLLLSGV